MKTEQDLGWKKFGVVCLTLINLVLVGCVSDPPDVTFVGKATMLGVVVKNPRVISVIENSDPFKQAGGTIIDSFFESLYNDVEKIPAARVIVCEIPLQVEGEGFFLLQAGPHSPFRNQHLKECVQIKRGMLVSVEVEKRYFWDGTGPFQKTVRLQHEESTL